MSTPQDLEVNTESFEPPAPAGLLASAVANYIHSAHEPMNMVDARPRDPRASMARKLDDVASSQTDASAIAKSIHGLRGWMHWIMAIGMILSVAAGALAAVGSLDVEGGDPVNIFWLLGAVLGGQTILLILWLLMLVFGGRLLRRWSIGGFLLGFSSWVAARVGIGGGSTGSSRKRQVQSAAAAVAETDFGGSRTRWLLGTLTNLAWLAFNIGLLGSLIGALYVRQFDFGWETTIGSDAAFERATEFVSIAPEWVGFEVPDQAQVLEARIDPGTGQLTAENETTRKAFSSLLIGSVVIYGLAPRFLLFMICLMIWRTTRRRWRPSVDSARFTLLRRLTEPQAVKVDSDDTGIAENTPPEEEEPPPVDRQTIGSAIIGIELHMPSCGWPPPCGAPVEDLGMVESREDRIATVRMLRYSTTLPARLVIIADISTTPDRGIARSIELVHEAADQPKLIVILSGGARFRDRVDASALERRIGDWRTMVKNMGVGGEIHEVDLDNLTAASRAQLSEAVSGSARPNLPIERGPVASIDAAFAEISAQVRRWHDAPTDKERLALHKAVARCAEAETGGRLLGTPTIEALTRDPREAIVEAGRGVLAMLPARLLASGRWASIGGTVGALACLATAGTVAPAVLAALPVWLATGAASGAGLAALKGPDESDATDELMETEGRLRGEAIAGAAMHTVLLTFQGRGERTIQEIMEKVFQGDPPELPDSESAAHALSRWRSKIVIADHESRSS
ncbi:MAG: DUF2868 domain-containing protein [Phycisphaerales bacterium]|nr:DUF2868 domain-containing protein [Phycisphaerales bacterium]